MKKYEIIILKEVDIQIQSILNYIYLETYDKNLIKNISDILYWACYSLNYFPYRYRVYFDNIRILNIKSFRIFYEVFEEEQKVVIFKILSQYQKY